MRAIQVQQFGGPEVLVAREAPDPVAGPGQVVVAVAAADVIYLDTLLRGGWGGEVFPLQPPYVPGGGVSGHVLTVGAGVDPAWVGRQVVTRTASGSGGYAERTIADADDLVEVPDGVRTVDAAAMVHDGVTALGLAEIAGLPRIAEGDWVLVAAAAGGAGSILVQLAHNAGARVVAAARGEHKLALARELGAALTVDYSVEGWQHRVREATGGAGVSIALDGAGGSQSKAVFETVAAGGTFVTYGTAGGSPALIDTDAAARLKIRAVNALESGPTPREARVALLKEALRLAAVGQIRSTVGATFPLHQAGAAHTSLQERSTLGKSLLLL
jgi:NADPH:quinone reductase